MHDTLSNFILHTFSHSYGHKSEARAIKSSLKQVNIVLHVALHTPKRKVPFQLFTSLLGAFNFIFSIPLQNRVTSHTQCMILSLVI